VRRQVLRTTGLLLALLLWGSHSGAQAQVATAPLPAWRAEPSATDGIRSWQRAWDVAPALWPVDAGDHRLLDTRRIHIHLAAAGYPHE
jgi:hypothetical protein